MKQQDGLIFMNSVADTMHDSFKVLCQDLANGRTKILDKIFTISSSRV